MILMTGTSFKGWVPFFFFEMQAVGGWVGAVGLSIFFRGAAGLWVLDHGFPSGGWERAVF
jgi:hypothetical protein